MPSLRWEERAWADQRLVVGIDEAGRGPLAGPVVAAAVVFPPHVRRIRGVRDSKLMAPALREHVAGLIRIRAVRVGVGAASSREIDRVNIRVASAIAMRRAVRKLFAGAPALQETAHLIVDGLPLPEIGYAHEAVVDGDALCYSVAAASILAKTVRDRIMRLLGGRHPAYLWERNAGYATPEHLDGITKQGVTRHHRITFGTVGQHDLFEEVHCCTARPSAPPTKIVQHGGRSSVGRAAGF